jgi:hypothetical protein
MEKINKKELHLFPALIASKTPRALSVNDFS